jgi:fatty-acyl-CoA synthase
LGFILTIHEHRRKAAALLEPLKDKVASWWIPDQVVRLANMPLASTGKIDKMRLRQEYGQS